MVSTAEPQERAGRANGWTDRKRVGSGACLDITSEPSTDTILECTIRDDIHLCKCICHDGEDENTPLSSVTESGTLGHCDSGSPVSIIRPQPVQLDQDQLEPT